MGEDPGLVPDEEIQPDETDPTPEESPKTDPVPEDDASTSPEL
jgi:hypothetical protein